MPLLEAGGEGLQALGVVAQAVQTLEEGRTPSPGALVQVPEQQNVAPGNTGVQPQGTLGDARWSLVHLYRVETDAKVLAAHSIQPGAVNQPIATWEPAAAKPQHSHLVAEMARRIVPGGEANPHPRGWKVCRAPTRSLCESRCQQVALR